MHMYLQFCTVCTCACIHVCFGYHGICYPWDICQTVHAGVCVCARACVLHACICTDTVCTCAWIEVCVWHRGLHLLPLPPRHHPEAHAGACVSYTHMHTSMQAYMYGGIQAHACPTHTTTRRNMHAPYTHCVLRTPPSGDACTHAGACVFHTHTCIQVYGIRMLL